MGFITHVRFEHRLHFFIMMIIVIKRRENRMGTKEEV